MKCPLLRPRIRRPDRLAFPHGLTVVVCENPPGTTGGGGRIDLRQPFCKVTLRRGVLWVGSEVGPFVRIGLNVVQFLAAVGVADVAPALVADRVVVLVVGGERRPGALG